MAEEGNKSEGGDEGQVDVNAEAQFAALDRAAFSEDAYTNPVRPGDIAKAERDWKGVIGRDERERAQRAIPSRSGSRHKGFQRRSRAHYSNAVHPTYHAPVHSSDVPYVKGSDLTLQQRYGQFVGNFSEGWRRFWSGI